MKISLLVVILSTFVIGCDRGAKTPEGLIRMFVNDLSNTQVEKSYFEKYTTGKVWDSVADLNEEDFNKFANHKKTKNAKVKILNKNCEIAKCTLTYIVSYSLSGANKSDFKSEVKKAAVLVKDGDIWKISEVANIKTFLEATNAIDVGPEN